MMEKSKMFSLVTVVFAAIASTLTGCFGLFYIGTSPLIHGVDSLGWMSVFFNWIVPLLPSAILLWCGPRTVAIYKRKIPDNTRLFYAAVIIITTGVVMYSLYACATGPNPVRHTAFNYGFISLPFIWLCYAMEARLWVRCG
jgi:hypothetical protein